MKSELLDACNTSRAFLLVGPRRIGKASLYLVEDLKTAGDNHLRHLGGSLALQSNWNSLERELAGYTFND